MNRKADVKTLFNQKPDIEVIFKFNGTRIHSAHDGYGPDHMIK